MKDISEIGIGLGITGITMIISSRALAWKYKFN